MQWAIVPHADVLQLPAVGEVLLVELGDLGEGTFLQLIEAKTKTG